MKLLAIETSCDETAITLLSATGTVKNAEFRIVGNALYSQAEKHAVYGGVYPSLAKREHAQNLVPLLAKVLPQTYADVSAALSTEQCAYLRTLLAREERLAEALIQYLPTIEKPEIDAIAVTHGPGLEPALWVGINFARALAYVWNVPIIPVNHLEGHMAASAVEISDTSERVYRMQEMAFPILGLILSGGHTEFVYAPSWGSYEVIGSTRDDSIGEAFDKVARLLGLPYPGGPELSRLGDKGRHALATRSVQSTQARKPLPRPMIGTLDLDFSFSGLKTAVLYQVRDIGELSDGDRIRIATEFEEAVTDVVLKKTERALVSHPVHTFVLGGGVSANTYLRKRLQHLFATRNDEVSLHLPADGLSTDNAIMIGMAGYLAHLRGEPTVDAQSDLRANGNLSLDTKK